MLPTTHIQGGGVAEIQKVANSRALARFKKLSTNGAHLSEPRAGSRVRSLYCFLGHHPSKSRFGVINTVVRAPGRSPDVVISSAYALELDGTIVNAVASLTFLRLRNATPETPSPHQQDTLYKLCCVLVYSNASTCKLLIGRHSNIARMNLAGCIYLAVEFDIHIE